VQRSTKASIKAYDENGKPFSMVKGGLIAQIFQHEIEHLDGILFTDHAKELKEVPPDPEEHEN
jgi:peptide deformylase